MLVNECWFCPGGAKVNYSNCYYKNKLVIAIVIFTSQTPLHTYNDNSPLQREKSSCSMTSPAFSIDTSIWLVLIFVRCLPSLSQKCVFEIIGFTPMNLKLHIIPFIILLFLILLVLSNFNLHHFCNKNNKVFFNVFKIIAKMSFQMPTSCWTKQ